MVNMHNLSQHCQIHYK